MKKLLFITVLFSLLSGCGLFTKKEPEKVYITKTEYVTVVIPETQRKKCAVTRPATPEYYMNLNLEEREEYLTDYSILLLGQLRDCDATRSSIIKIVDNTNEVYKDKTNERKP